MSEITIIDDPVTNPDTEPSAYPLMKVRVSVNPIFIRIPYSGCGANSATVSTPILPTAPTAMRTAVSATGLEDVVLITPGARMDYPASL
jgi:hypothetical protein